MSQQFISQPLFDVVSDTAALARGEPGAPLAFNWAGQDYEVAQVLERWKGVNNDRTHGSNEQYVHKHWFKVRTADGTIMTIYFERQPRRRGQATMRWWLYSLD